MLIQVVRFWDRVPRFIKRGIGRALLAVFLLIALSFVPAVSAHVPGMKVISRTVRKALGLKPAPSSKKATAPKRSEQKQTQRPAPKIAQKTAPKTSQKAAPKVASKTTQQSTPKVAPKTAQTTAPKTTQKPARAKSAATLPFTVKSTPSGATVQVDGRAAGKTPVTLKLPAGTHRVTITRSGYAPVNRTVIVKKGVTASLSVKLAAATRATKPKAGSPTAKVSSAPKRSQTTTSTAKPLVVGAQAPAITLKDSRGTVHRLNALRGRKVVVLFIWALDSKTKALIEELDSHVRSAGEDYPAMVVLAGGDAAGARKYAEAARVLVPLLPGGEGTAHSYGVPRGTTVVYVVSEFGTIAQRQVNNIQLTPLFPRPRG